MWPNVREELESSKTSVLGIRRELQPVMDAGPKGGFFGTQKKVWKLGLSLRPLKDYRRRLHVHHMALKVSANVMRM